MKKYRRIWLLPLIFGLVFILAACSVKQSKNKNVYQEVKQSKTITWGVRADTRLFGLMSVKTGKIEGFEIDLAKALTKQILGKDAKAKFVQTTPKTRIPLLKNGNIDAILATMTITPERAKQVDFTKPYFPSGQSLLVPDSSKIKDVKDLNGKTVLAVKGTTAVDNMAKFAPKAKVLEYDDYGQAFTALKAGQGQAMTTDNGVLAGIASENRGYKLVGGTFTQEPYGIAVNKGQTKLLNKLNQALVEVKKNGTYHRIVEKWFGGVPGFKEVENE
ncbi:putative glutamine transport system substrate-binding protein [Lactobacillus colini]|uniref:Glutamine transport system substrate-binding protein n=1 Tax=Lactobacillus colini TaxID=1819254 RepID=A0ABS4MCY2_9LACO|nr:transporter substrate-binding domain-containing protein [Lactobacillus colini]MBP2057543.1 putative glutamine transport system substrate-binding protein [Lactobacillus colini]